MKLCIPIVAPDGLNSATELHLPQAEYLLFFDTETRQHLHIALNEQQAGAATDCQMDAVLCGSISRVALRALLEQNIKVYGIDSSTAAEAIALYESGVLEAVSVPASGGCCSGQEHGEQGGGHAHGSEQGCGGGGCGSHGAGHGHEGGGCGGHGGGNDHKHAHEGGGCCGSRSQQPGAAAVKKPQGTQGNSLKIAVCSQNRKTVTEHAGKCRKFWIYEVKQGQVIGKTLLELPIEQALHSSPSGQPHVLDEMNVLITGSIGSGLQQRLLQRGIQGLVTTETDPDQAVAVFLSGEFERMPPNRAWVSACSEEGKTDSACALPPE